MGSAATWPPIESLSQRLKITSLSCKRQNMDIAHGGTDKSHEQVIDICVFGLVIDYHCCH